MSNTIRYITGIINFKSYTKLILQMPNDEVDSVNEMCQKSLKILYILITFQ